MVNNACENHQLFRCVKENCEDVIRELTLAEIFLGTHEFEGLLQLIRIYLRSIVGCGEDML